MAHTFYPSTWEAEAGRFWVRGQPGLQSEFQDSQGYTEKLCLKKTKQKRKVNSLCFRYHVTEASRSLSSRLAWDNKFKVNNSFGPGLVVDTFNLGHTFCWRYTSGQWKKEGFLPLCLLALASTFVGTYFIRIPVYTEQLKQVASWDWATTRFLDFLFTAAHCWVNWTADCKYSNYFSLCIEISYKFGDSRELWLIQWCSLTKPRITQMTENRFFLENTFALFS